MIKFLGFCDYVESCFHKNDENLKFYFKTGNNVNIIIDDPTGINEFKLDNLESLVTIENNSGEGLELDDQGKIKLLGGTNEWDSKGDIDKIVGFLEGISKMNLGTDFKGLDVTAGNIGKFLIDKFEVSALNGDDNINNTIQWLTVLGKARNKGIGKYFENMEVVNNFDQDNNDITIFDCNVNLENYFSNDVGVCQRFFDALYPDGKYYVQNESGNAGIYRNDGTNNNKVGVLNASGTV